MKIKRVEYLCLSYLRSNIWTDKVFSKGTKANFLRNYIVFTDFGKCAQSDRHTVTISTEYMNYSSQSAEIFFDSIHSIPIDLVSYKDRMVLTKSDQYILPTDPRRHELRYLTIISKSFIRYNLLKYFFSIFFAQKYQKTIFLNQFLISHIFSLCLQKHTSAAILTIRRLGHKQRGTHKSPRGAATSYVTWLLLLSGIKSLFTGDTGLLFDCVLFILPYTVG